MLVASWSRGLVGAICRIYERAGRGVKIIAQVNGGRVTGSKAGEIRKLLKRYGYPNAPLEAVMDQLLMSQKKLGVMYVAGKDEE